MVRSLLVLSMLAACGGPEENRPPVTVVELVELGDDRYLLDASASYDPDQDAVELAWVLERAPDDAPLVELEPVRAGVVRLDASTPGVWIIRATASDGRARGDAQTVVIDTEPAVGLTADAGPDRSSDLGQVITLDGRASRGGPTTWLWSLAEVPESSQLVSSDIEAGDTSVARVTPDVAGAYTLRLTVTAPPDQVASDEMLLMMLPAQDNGQPVASASAPATAEVCTEVDLDCSASFDPDGDPLFPWWSLQRAPESFRDNAPQPFSDPDALRTTVFPDVRGDYTFACSVFDGRTWSRPAPVDVEVVDRSTNRPPRPDAGEDVRIDMTSTCTCPMPGRPWTSDCSCPGCVPPTVVLDVSVDDPDDVDATLAWSFASGGVRFLGPTDEPEVSLLTPGIEPPEPGVYEDVTSVQVQATDCPGAIGTDTVTITATCVATYAP